jgi:tetratricopeptide (TPR) repeat protein
MNYSSGLRLSALQAIVLVLMVTTAQAQAPPPRPVDDQILTEMALTKSSDLPRIIDDLKKSLDKNPNCIAALNDLGVAYNTARRFQNALDCLARAVELVAKIEPVYANLGVAYLGLQRIPDGIEAFRQAVKLDPASGNAHYNLGSLYGRVGRFSEAIDELKEAARLDPNSGSICINRGTTYKLAGRNEEALDAFKEAVRRWPTHPAANFSLGTAYYDLGRYREAVDTLEKPIECCKENCELYMTRGFSYLFPQQAEAAASDAAACLKQNGWRNTRSVYMALVGYFGYKLAGQEKSSAEILEEAANSAEPKAWPYPVIQYLRRQITIEDLLALARDNDQRTEAHAYVGFGMLLNGLTDQAMEHFRWVSQYGNQRFFEYHLAQVELNRVEGKPSAK